MNTDIIALISDYLKKKEIRIKFTGEFFRLGE